MTAITMTKLGDTGKNRRYLVEEVLNTEVFGIAQSLASDQFSLYHGTKSSTMASLIQTSDTGKIKRDQSGWMIDISMLLRKKQPSQVQSFADFSKFLQNKIMDISSLLNRCDIIADGHSEVSLKEGTREDCGARTWLIIIFDDCSEIPPKFITKLLSNVTNKTILSKSLENKFLAYHEGKQSILSLTFGYSIIITSEVVFLETEAHQCNSEEADPRIVCHVIKVGKKGYSDVRVKAVDSDVVILCLTYADVAMSTGIETFFVVYGSKNKKVYIIDYFNTFAVSMCKGLAFFHAFTGCDIVPSHCPISL